MRLFPGSANLPGTLLAAALVAGEGLLLVVGLLRSGGGILRLPAHMRTPEDLRGACNPSLGLAELGDIWDGDRREGEDEAWLSSRFLGGDTLWPGAPVSVKRFSTDNVRPDCEASCVKVNFCGLDVRRVGGLKGLKGLFARRIVGLWTN